MEVATGVINCHCCVFWCQQWVYLGKWIECSIMSINSILGGCSCHDVTRWFVLLQSFKIRVFNVALLKLDIWDGSDYESTCVKCFSWRQLDFLVHEDISSLISGASSALKPDRGSQVFNSLGRGGTTCASPAVILHLADIHWSLVTTLLLVTVISLFTC